MLLKFHLMPLYMNEFGNVSRRGPRKDMKSGPLFWKRRRNTYLEGMDSQIYEVRFVVLEPSTECTAQYMKSGSWFWNCGRNAQQNI